MKSKTKQSTSSQLTESQLQNYHMQLLDKLVINNNNNNNNNHYYYYYYYYYYCCREQLVNSLEERVGHLEDQLSEATSLQVC